MAAVSTLQAPKRKKLVYGKLGKTGYSTANFFDDEDELASSSHSVGRQSKVKATYTVQKTEARAHRLKPARPRAKRQDTFDVPSSDDENREGRVVEPLPRYQANLVDDSTEQPFAPWEKRNAEARNAVTKRRKTPEASPEGQLKHDLLRASQSPENRVGRGPSQNSASPVLQRSSSVTSPSGHANCPNATSAAARLAARKRLAESTAPSSADESLQFGRAISKRTIQATDHREGTPRKRARIEALKSAGNDDIAMTDVAPIPAAETATAQAAVPGTETQDVYEFPDTSADESSKTRPAMAKQKSSKSNARRGKPTTYSRSTPRKGLSAPGRLAEMIATDTDTTEAPTRSPSVSTSRKSTPQQPSTPPSGRMRSPQAASKATGTLTPKQVNLWSKLLPSDPSAPSPSMLPIKDLSISGSRRTGGNAFVRRLSKSQSEVGRRRTRLVDRLKASAPESDEELSSGAEDDEATDKVDMTDRDAKASNLRQPPKLQRQPSQSQSQSQSTSAAANGPKITYSRVRSYLPEDNIEADLMLGIETEASQRTTSGNRGTSQRNQQSTFDLDGSDDEDGPGKMRSIHELRASGSNARGMGDIEDLLDDIEKHNASQRGSRRTALMNLAANMMDKPFKSRFIGQSCESRLAAECDAYSDEIADVILTATLCLLLESEPPEHVVRSLQDYDIAEWLSRHLGKHAEISKMAKDRKNNMSKSAQTTLVQLADRLRSHITLWNENVPATITPRTLALKALDLLVRAVRRLGDRSEILTHSQVEELLINEVDASAQAKQLDLALSVSVLESLSTTATTINWPSTVIQAIAVDFPQLNSSTKLLRDCRFLALRLSLNLTNDNATNCALLSEHDDGKVVKCLLASIKTGFGDLVIEEDPEKKAIALDLLVLAIGIMINLSEHSHAARRYAISDSGVLESLIGTFQRGQKRMLDAESEEESIANVTYGYLAVMLANICQDPEAKAAIASKLPAQNLRMLVEAVEEFVAHHQKVDTLNFEGEEGMEVWSAFTEKLKSVLVRLKEVEATR